MTEAEESDVVFDRAKIRVSKVFPSDVFDQLEVVSPVIVVASVLDANIADSSSFYLGSSGVSESIYSLLWVFEIVVTSHGLFFVV